MYYFNMYVYLLLYVLPPIILKKFFSFDWHVSRLLKFSFEVLVTIFYALLTKKQGYSYICMVVYSC